MSRVLAIDYGDARVGIAVSDQSRFLASGYGYIKFTGYNDLVEKLLAIGEKEEIKEFVIGLPLNMDGSRGAMAKKTEKLAGMLESKTEYPVNLVDETLSSWEAAKQIHASGKKARKGKIDEVAAAIILQAFLDGNKNQ
ncbi:MAG: Holliday junction resolvase RuvX [candidate division Zixibacteria bacterium]|nr:Holliday junction resolvase RuvX [candidate division Zixibacteria bacterium]